MAIPPLIYIYIIIYNIVKFPIVDIFTICYNMIVYDEKRDKREAH